MAGMTESLARRALDRSAAARHAEYVREVQHIVDATYRLIERTGGIDPSLREVLAEAGLSTQAFYRFFRSKDELMLVILDDGRRQLLGYLEHRMARATSPSDKVRAWIEGVLAQASNPEAAARTRPFLVNQDRLVEAFPEEQQASVDLLVGLLVDSLEELRSAGPGRAARRGAGTARRDAEAVYRLALATLHDHLVRGTTPSGDDVEHLVGFVLRGVGAGVPPVTPAAARVRGRNSAP
jgi:AcrR family transcriptional regulator